MTSADLGNYFSTALHFGVCDYRQNCHIHLNLHAMIAIPMKVAPSKVYFNLVQSSVTFLE